MHFLITVDHIELTKAHPYTYHQEFSVSFSWLFTDTNGLFQNEQGKCITSISQSRRFYTKDLSFSSNRAFKQNDRLDVKKARNFLK